ncbi:type ISP restriction/modification enzyme [Flavobacterium album]|uniref:type ISP restriction/modification enzyme n=1 Tax=Flavobacterium album TaxID=2175091 RepID=UPI001FE9FB56|nr:type ISP restriction/modification enzyme [Flavobacterium album]
MATARDSWVYNSSKTVMSSSMKKTIDFYNEQRIDFANQKSSATKDFNTYCSNDPKKISWNDSLKNLCAKNQPLSFNETNIITGIYRPYSKLNLYFDKNFIQRPYQQTKLFAANLKNIVICVSGLGGSKNNSIYISKYIPDLNLLDAGTQCFPLYYYEENNATQKGLFDNNDEQQFTRRDAISNFILKRAVAQYGKNVTKEDIFYYVYGFLHSKEYRETFANDLKKMLPRLPLVEDVRDFWKFSKAGRQLADLHLNYESVPPAPGVIVLHNPLSVKDSVNALGTDEVKYVDYEVQKMRYPKKGQTETIIYNSRITIDNIPAKAYEYVVNGKSAIDWIMERYQVTVHKDSGIKNDPNDWAREHNNPRYILDLLLSVINVSVQTVDIVEGLPKVSFE